eukprot:scaffold22381_cov139-Skeletonema_marinoi.AAC.2
MLGDGNDVIVVVLPPLRLQGSSCTHMQLATSSPFDWRGSRPACHCVTSIPFTPLQGLFSHFWQMAARLSVFPCIRSPFFSQCGCMKLPKPGYLAKVYNLGRL